MEVEIFEELKVGDFGSTVLPNCWLRRENLIFLIGSEFFIFNFQFARRGLVGALTRLPRISIVAGLSPGNTSQKILAHTNRNIIQMMAQIVETLKAHKKMHICMLL